MGLTAAVAGASGYAGGELLRLLAGHPDFEIGPLSGKSNVVFWLERHGIPTDDATVTRILDAAKNSARILTDEELHSICAGVARN